MSAPCSSGRQRYGDASVLSITSGMPFSCAIAGHALEVEHVALRVADGLAVERPGVRPDRGAPRVEVVGVVDEGDLDAELRQRVVEQVVGAAVERRDDTMWPPFSARLAQGDRLRGLPAGRGQRADAALERGDALLEHGLGGVHDARVDVAELLRARTGRRRARCRGTRSWWSGRSGRPGRRWSGRARRRRAPAWSRIPSSRTCRFSSRSWAASWRLMTVRQKS